EEYPKALANKQQYEQIYQVVSNADQAVQKELGKATYTQEELKAIKPKNEQMQQSVAILSQMFSYGEAIPKVLADLTEGIEYFTEQVNYNLNKDFDGRAPVGDDPYDITDTGYGNGDQIGRAHV